MFVVSPSILMNFLSRVRHAHVSCCEVRRQCTVGWSLTPCRLRCSKDDRSIGNNHAFSALSQRARPLGDVPTLCCGLIVLPRTTKAVQPASSSQINRFSACSSCGCCVAWFLPGSWCGELALWLSAARGGFGEPSSVLSAILA